MILKSNSNPIIGAIGLILFLVVAFYLVKSIVWVLALIAPVLLILTLIMDHKVVTGYLKWIGKLFRTKWYYGLGAAAMTFFGFTFVSAFLFGKAMLKKKFAGNIGGPLRQEREEFTEFEEVESEIIMEDGVFDDNTLTAEELQLPEIDENLNTLEEDNTYDNLFENDK